MSNALDKRLDQILPVITSDEFLNATGLGNEIAFHIFDYPPEDEIRVRKHVEWLMEQIPKRRPGTKVIHINLFEFLIEHLKERGLLERAFVMQREKGDKALGKALSGPLHEEKLSKVFAEVARPDEHDLVLVSGVGSVYPLIRTHTLLNNLQPFIGMTPLIMFYPGRYDGVSLRLFGKTSLSAGASSGTGKRPDPYYRAFRLIPEEPKYAH